MKKITIY